MSNSSDSFKNSVTKGGFFSESTMCFLDLQISKKKYSKNLSWAWNLNFPPITLYWFGDLKNELHFRKKKTHLVLRTIKTGTPGFDKLSTALPEGQKKAFLHSKGKQSQYLIVSLLCNMAKTTLTLSIKTRNLLESSYLPTYIVTT